MQQTVCHNGGHEQNATSVSSRCVTVERLWQMAKRILLSAIEQVVKHKRSVHHNYCSQSMCSLILL
jgi:hypothetical protein